MLHSAGQQISYSRVFAFVGGNDAYDGTFNLARKNNVGSDALLQANEPNGLNITHFGFCVYQNSGSLSITKVVPTNLGGNFVVRYECSLGGVVVAQGDVSFTAAGGSQTIAGIPMGNNPPPETVCTITEPTVDTALYVPVLPEPVTLLKPPNVAAVTVTNNPAVPGTLEVIKVLDGQVSGAVPAFDFVITCDGADIPVSGGAGTVYSEEWSAGSVCSVAELAEAGFVQVGVLDTHGNTADGAVVLEAGRKHTVTITNRQVKADLVVDKIVNKSTLMPGQGTATFTLSVTNAGPDAATEVKLTDVLPAGLTVVGSPTASQGSWSGLVWNVGDLASGASATATITVNVPELAAGATSAMRYENCASATSAVLDGNAANNRDCATVSRFWQGNTPGYWKNHPSAWPIPTTTTLGSVFTAMSSVTNCRTVTANASLMTALSYKGGRDYCGKLEILLRAATAAYLNELHFGATYPIGSTGELQAMVNAAIASRDLNKIISLATYLDVLNNAD